MFARSDAALAHLLDIVCHGCWKAGAAVNATKLRTFKIRLVSGRLTYLTGSTYPQIGPLRHHRGGLCLAGIPLLMGDTLRPSLQSTLRKLQTIHAGICRLRPSYILALRVVISFAISRLDYLFDALPPPPTCLQSLQRAVNNALTVAINVPRSIPKALLYAPLSVGGFGIPNLTTRFQLRFIAGVLRALNSRNSLVRRTTRWMLQHPTTTPSNNDVYAFITLLQQYDLQVVTVRLL